MAKSNLPRFAWTILGMVLFWVFNTQAQTSCPLTRVQSAELTKLDGQIAQRNQELQVFMNSAADLRKSLEAATSLRHLTEADTLTLNLNSILELGSAKYAEMANLQIARDELQSQYCRQNREHVEADVRPDLKGQPNSRIQR